MKIKEILGEVHKILAVMLLEGEKWYRVSFRLFGDGLPIESIETKLGISPDHIGRKGEHHRGNPSYAKYPTNIWVSSSSADSNVSFEEQITPLLDILESIADDLKDLLILPDVSGELFLGFSSGDGQGGAELSPALLKRIANLGLTLSLDLYPPDIDEVEQLNNIG